MHPHEAAAFAVASTPVRAAPLLRERTVRRVEKALSDGLGEIDRRAAARLAEIDTDHRTVIQPALTKEIARDPRYSDPAAGVSRGMLDTLNRARNASRPAAARPDR